MLLRRSLLPTRKCLPFPSSIHQRLLSSISQNQQLQTQLLSQQKIDENQISTIFSIITSSQSPQQMLQSLSSLDFFPLSNPSLLDSILKRARFSHANPFRTLHFFNLTISNTDNNCRHPNFQKAQFTPTPFAYNTMLYILGRGRRFQESWDLLVEMKRVDPALISTTTLQVVLGRIAKVCSVRQTVESFKRFKKLVKPFDVTCFNALLRTLCQEKSMSDARNVYHSLKYDFNPDIQTFNILLSGWKSIEDAESFLKEMKELGVKPDVVTYNCLIDVYCKNKDVGKAYKVFEEMREREIWPDVISYTSLIAGLGLVGQPDKAKDVLNEMREVGCYPDVTAYNATIKNYCIAKRMGNAFALMDEMRSKGLSPNATSYNLFFRVFYWANDVESAWRLYRRMKGEDGCLPNVQSCMFLVRLCKRNEKIEMAMELWDDMVEREFGSFRLVSDVLFELLCDWGKLEEAEKCFVEMAEKGHRPSNVSFRRIKVLMELGNKQESIRNLSEKMAKFGNSIGVDDERDREGEEIALESGSSIKCSFAGETLI